MRTLQSQKTSHLLITLLLFSAISFSCAKRNVTGNSSEEQPANDSTLLTNAEPTKVESSKPNSVIAGSCSEDFIQKSSSLVQAVVDAHQENLYDSNKNEIAKQACSDFTKSFAKEDSCQIQLQVEISDEPDDAQSSDEPTIETKKAESFYKICDEFKEKLSSTNPYFNFLTRSQGTSSAAATSGQEQTNTTVRRTENLILSLQKGQLQFKVLKTDILQKMLADQASVSNGQLITEETKARLDTNINCSVTALSDETMDLSGTFQMMTSKESLDDDSLVTTLGFLDSAKNSVLVSCKNPSNEQIDIDDLKKAFDGVLQFTLKRLSRP